VWSFRFRRAEEEEFRNGGNQVTAEIGFVVLMYIGHGKDGRGGWGGNFLSTFRKEKKLLGRLHGKQRYVARGVALGAIRVGVTGEGRVTVDGFCWRNVAQN